MDPKALDISQLHQNPEFKNLTVEQAIRLLGEKEKARIIAEREKLLQSIGCSLDKLALSNKAIR